jgi:hypothetical protein
LRSREAILELQRSAGNAAVAAGLGARRLQRMRTFRVPDGVPAPSHDESARLLLQHLEREVFPLLSSAADAAEAADEGDAAAATLRAHRLDLDQLAAALATGPHTAESNQAATEQVERVRVWYEATASAQGWPRELQDLGVLVPARGSRPARARFGVQTGEWKADIGNRAATSAWGFIDTSADAGEAGFEERLTRGARYRPHPAAIDLGEAFAGLGQGAQIRVEIPRVKGEVMYVITLDYRLIIGARSGSQHQFPHPTVVGGEDPEVLSAGIVEFEEGRIRRLKVNDSGHFRPNAPSSFEVAAGLLSRLPRSAFHPTFEMTVFREGPPRLLDGPVGGGDAPFDVAETDVERTPKGAATPAVTVEAGFQGIKKLRKRADWKTAARNVLQQDVAGGNTPESRLALVFNGQMRALWVQVTTRIRTLPQNQRFRSAVNDPKFVLLLNELEAVLEQLEVEDEED